MYLFGITLKYQPFIIIAFHYLKVRVPVMLQVFTPEKQG